MKALLVLVALIASLSGMAGCATFGPPCTGDPTKMNCTCGGQRNPGCLPWITDAKKPTTTTPGGTK